MTATLIFARKLFDPYSLEILKDQVISVSEESGLIFDVESRSKYEETYGTLDLQDPRVINLSDSTVLPGFVDTHVHLFLHPYSETTWYDQLTKETLVERTIRATNHAKATLMAGFTTVRDLGTEGAGDADIALRKCLSGSNPIIPGPRYFCASRAIVPTGAYGPKGNLNVSQEGVEGITGAEAADGRDECRKVVRRQIGAGADWIKIYADYRFRSRMADVAINTSKASLANFTSDEVSEIVQTAHYYGVKVSAHATTTKALYLTSLLASGIDTIEHGYDISDDLLQIMADRKIIWVPTLAAYYTLGRGASVSGTTSVWDRAQQTFRNAMKIGVRIACGGDTGVFAHGENALELQLMYRLGADWKSILRWATLGGWECVRSMEWEGQKGEERLEKVQEWGEGRNVVGDNEMPFGAVRKGFAADIIATTGDLDADFENAVSSNRIDFVMKGGKVYKWNGNSVV